MPNRAPSPLLTGPALGAYDDALAVIHAYDPDYSDRLSSHATMVAETLARRGHEHVIKPWLAAYVGKLKPITPPTGMHVTSENWRDALAQPERSGDWIAYFGGQLDATPWADVLATWVPRLLDGAMASSTHGVIRVAHAVRALSAHDSHLRRSELAHGLGYWAATWQATPHLTLSGSRSWADALAAVPLDPTIRGRFFTKLLRVQQVPGFAEAVTSARDVIDWDGMSGALISALADAGQPDPDMITHALTALVSLRTLAAVLPVTMERDLHHTAWIVAATVYAMYPAPAQPSADAPPYEPQAAWRYALTTLDEHDLKRADALLTTEACFR